MLADLGSRMTLGVTEDPRWVHIGTLAFLFRPGTLSVRPGLFFLLREGFVNSKIIILTGLLLILILVFFRTNSQSSSDSIEREQTTVPAISSGSAGETSSLSPAKTDAPIPESYPFAELSLEQKLQKELSFTPYSVYPFSPYDVYQENIEAAEDGNLESQFLVARAMQECMAVPNSAGRLQASSPRLSVRALEIVSARYERCEPLFHEIVSPEQEYFRWIKAAIAGEHELALARDVLLHRFNEYSYEDAKRIFRDALYAHSTNQEVYSNLAGYYANHARRAQYKNENQAASYLRCKYAVSCDLDSHMQRLRTEFQEHQVKEIIGISQAFEVAIRERDWVVLGLENGG